MNCPKISIVIPSLNQGKYIEQTIKSIIDQHYPSLELILIDGGSSDDTVQVLKKYESEITYWVSEPDNGQAHAINKGLAVATGEIFNWINSDDFLEPGSLYLIGEYFYNNPDKNVLCGYTRCFYDKDNSTSHIYRMGVKANATDTILSLEMNQPGTFYRTPILRSLGGVNESLRYVFDNELWIRYLGKYGVSGVGKIDQLLAQFRLHGSSKSVGEGFDKFQLEQNAIIKNLAFQLKMPDYILKEIAQEKKVSYYQSMEIDISTISPTKFTAYYSIKYLSKWYHSQKTILVRQSIKFIIKHNVCMLPLSRKYIAIYYNVLFHS